MRGSKEHEWQAAAIAGCPVISQDVCARSWLAQPKLSGSGPLVSIPGRPDAYRPPSTRIASRFTWTR